MLLKICNKKKFRLNRNFLDTKYVFTDHVIFDRDECCDTRENAVRMRAFPASGANLHVPPPIEIIRDTKTN